MIRLDNDGIQMTGGVISMEGGSINLVGGDINMTADSRLYLKSSELHIQTGDDEADTFVVDADGNLSRIQFSSGMKIESDSTAGTDVINIGGEALHSYNGVYVGNDGISTASGMVVPNIGKPYLQPTASAEKEYLVTGYGDDNVRFVVSKTQPESGHSIVWIKPGDGAPVITDGAVTYTDS